MQLLLANHVDHDVSDPLVAVQFDASNAFCSVFRQPQFDVLAGMELEALSASHALLLQDYGCVEWTSESDRVPAPLAVSIALPFV